MNRKRWAWGSEDIQNDSQSGDWFWTVWSKTISLWSCPRVLPALNSQIVPCECGHCEHLISPNCLTIQGIMMHFAYLRYAESTKDRACPHDLRIRKHGTEERRCPCTSLESYKQIFQDLSDCACVHNLCWYLQVCILLYLLGKFTYMGNHGDINCWQTNTHWWHAVISLCFCFLPTRVASKKTLRLYDSPARFELSQPGAFRSQSLPPSKTSFSVIFQILSDNFNWTNTWKTDEAWLELELMYLSSRKIYNKVQRSAGLEASSMSFLPNLYIAMRVSVKQKLRTNEGRQIPTGSCQGCLAFSASHTLTIFHNCRCSHHSHPFTTFATGRWPEAVGIFLGENIQNGLVHIESTESSQT